MNKENIQKFDKHNIYDVLKRFPEQIKYILDNNNLDKINLDKISSILICGMGGSAIGGDLLNAIVKDQIKIPIFINRDYKLPNWVSESTLIILSSYSGNTEEVLYCYNESIEKGLEPVIISSGGELLNNAKNNNLLYFIIPKGYMPRFALGYNIGILLLLLVKIDLLNNSIIDDLINLSNILKIDADAYSSISDNNVSIVLAEKIYNKFNIIYTSANMEVVGLRFRAQLAENAKILSSHYILPEQNHNEIEAFKNIDTKNINIIWVNDLSIHKRIKDRIDITSLLYEKIISQEKIEFKGNSYLDRIMKLIYFFDWVSYYCSLLNQTDPYEIPNINKLKKML